MESKKEAKMLNFCDDCVHFQPTDNPKIPNNELCKFNRELKFRNPRDPMDYDWGFYCPGCKDFVQSD